jgi:hypothetical protein
MNYWPYQMAAHGDAKDDPDERWRPNDFRRDVSEGETVTWKWHKPMNIQPRGGICPAPGDKIVFFFCKTGLRATERAGVYGFGAIERFSNVEGRFLRFSVFPPTDALKRKPLWDREMRRLIDRIRGKWNQGTMWQMNVSQFNKVCARMETTAP